MKHGKPYGRPKKKTKKDEAWAAIRETQAAHKETERVMRGKALFSG